MEELKCKSCGANLDHVEGNIFECKHCNTKLFIKVDKEFLAKEAEKKANADAESPKTDSVETLNVDASQVSDGTVKTEEVKLDKNGNPIKKKKRFTFGFGEIKESFKRSKEHNKNAKEYAIIGIILSVCAILLVWPCFKGGVGTFSYLINSFFGNLAQACNNNVVIIIFGGLFGCILIGVVGITLFLVPAVLAVYALIFPIFQLIMNRRWWSWVSLVIGILTIPACILVMILLISTI